MSVLEIEGLTKSFRSRFPTHVVDAVKGLDLDLEAGSVVAFVGPNGAGKTTTLMAILGLLKPDAGRVSVFGEPAGSLSARRRLGFQSEIFHTYPFHTARRALRFYGTLSGMSGGALTGAVDTQLERLGIARDGDRRVSTFSKGMTQRLGLASALLHEPELLLLDEPTTGLDPEGRKLVADIIAAEKARGRTIFLNSHILTDVERSCDHVVMIRAGELVLTKDLRDESGSPDSWVVELGGQLGGAQERLAASGFSATVSSASAATFRCTTEDKAALVRLASELGLDIARVERRTESLEELYMRYVGSPIDD